MSHFSCLVAGPDPEYQLAPFHEFECTGVRDEFVKEFDKTAEYREEYEKETTSRLRAPDGSLHYPYADRFYRVATTDAEKACIAGNRIMGFGFSGELSFSSRNWSDESGYSTRFQFIPDGWERTEVAVKDVESFAEWVEGYYGHKPCTYATMEPEGAHKYGYILVDDAGAVIKCVDCTNPDKQWDWWKVGGRWSGQLLLKDGRKVDQATKGEIDWPAMEREAGSDASHKYLTARVILDQHPVWESWYAIRDRNAPNIDEARNQYNSQPAVQAYKKIDSWNGPDEFLIPHADYVQNAVDSAYPGFAFVHDRKWSERGSMGWFGCVSGEVPPPEWNKAKREFVQSLPDDTLLTLVDCHI